MIKRKKIEISISISISLAIQNKKIEKKIATSMVKPPNLAFNQHSHSLFV